MTIAKPLRDATLFGLITVLLPATTAASQSSADDDVRVYAAVIRDLRSHLPSPIKMSTAAERFGNAAGDRVRDVAAAASVDTVNLGEALRVCAAEQGASRSVLTGRDSPCRFAGARSVVSFAETPVYRADTARVLLQWWADSPVRTKLVRKAGSPDTTFSEMWLAIVVKQGNVWKVAELRPGARVHFR